MAMIMDKLVGKNLLTNMTEVWPRNPQKIFKAKSLMPLKPRLKIKNKPTDTNVISKTAINLLINFFFFIKINVTTDKKAAELKTKIEENKYLTM
jgi:hypothetical protein